MANVSLPKQNPNLSSNKKELNLTMFPTEFMVEQLNLCIHSFKSNWPIISHH